MGPEPSLDVDIFQTNRRQHKRTVVHEQVLTAWVAGLSEPPKPLQAICQIKQSQWVLPAIGQICPQLNAWHTDNIPPSTRAATPGANWLALFAMSTASSHLI